MLKLKMYLPILLILGLDAQAQKKDSNTVSPVFIASWQPIFSFTNILRLDFEVKPKNRYLNFIISPEIYSGNTYDRFSFKEMQIDKLNGVGIGLSHKIDLNLKKNRPYVSYGFMYRDLEINYKGEGFMPYLQEGLQYYKYSPFSDKLNINSILFNTCVGFQAKYFDRFILDIYAGAGFKKSNKKSEYPALRNYDQEQFSYAYNGSLFLSGIKIGYLFN